MHTTAVITLSLQVDEQKIKTEDFPCIPENKAVEVSSGNVLGLTTVYLA